MRITSFETLSARYEQNRLHYPRKFEAYYCKPWVVQDRRFYDSILFLRDNCSIFFKRGSTVMGDPSQRYTNSLSPNGLSHGYQCAETISKSCVRNTIFLNNLHPRSDKFAVCKQNSLEYQTFVTI